MYIDEKSEQISPDKEFETLLDTNKEDKEVPTEYNEKQEDKCEYYVYYVAGTLILKSLLNNINGTLLTCLIIYCSINVYNVFILLFL